MPLLIHTAKQHPSACPGTGDLTNSPADLEKTLAARSNVRTKHYATSRNHRCSYERFHMPETRRLPLERVCRKSPRFSCSNHRTNTTRCLQKEQGMGVARQTSLGHGKCQELWRNIVSRHKMSKRTNHTSHNEKMDAWRSKSFACLAGIAYNVAVNMKH
jgi:hypothetical protein